MTFGNPTYLWAFLGLLVPIAIHLWSKKEAKTIKIGSIQLLTTSDSKQSQRIQLNELLLLILRMLVISMVVLIISEPKWKANSDNTAITYIIEPSLLKNNVVSKLLDSLSDEIEIRVLKANLPEWNLDTQIDESSGISKYWQLMEEMNTLKTDSIVVIANAYMQGFKGKRPNTAREINWIVLDSGSTIKKTLKAIQLDENVKLVSVLTDAQSTSIVNEVISNKDERLQYNLNKDSIQIMNSETEQALPISKENPIKVLLYHSENFIAEKTYIEASFKALNVYLNRTIDLEFENKFEELVLDTYDLVIWLGDDAPPKTTKRLLIFNEDEFAYNLITPTAHKNIFQLTTRLNIENSTSGRLTEELLDLLDLNVDLKKQISEVDQQKMDEKELIPNNIIKEAKNIQFASLDISKWFWLVLSFLMMLERLLANYKKQ